MQKRICEVYKETTKYDWTCQKCFAQIYAGNFLLNSALQLRRAVKINDGQNQDITWE